MAQLALTNVITISVSQASLGLNAYNTSNLALFTDEVPTGSVETLTFSGTAASGNFVIKINGTATSSIAWNASVATIQADVNAVSGFSQVVVTGSIASGTLTFAQDGSYGALPLFVISSNSLQTSGSVAITVTPTVTNAGWSGNANGYAAYVTPTQVGVDFGTASKTYAMANAVFSQQPNILTGGGQLLVILLQVSVQVLTFSALAASGAFEITYGASTTASIAWNASVATIQSDMQALTGLASCQVFGNISAETLTFILYGVYGAATTIGTTSNTLQTSGSASITITQSTTRAGETVDAAITRTQGVVQYFGVMVDENVATIGQSNLLAIAAVIQPLNLIGFFVSNSSSDINPGGTLDLLRTGSFTQTRGLYYGDSSVMNDLVMCASYAGRALSTNFNGSNTTQTMHLKALSGVQPDPTMTQTLLNNAIAAGADTYVSIQGVPSVFCSGANSYYDQIYNQLWFVGALQVAGFNYLAQTNTKIPQTEAGMSGLKGAYRAICQQAVTNGYSAPGTWNSSTTFGNQTNLINNVAQFGYYIFSSPVSTQSQTARAARQAPLVQIALKQAGAIQSSTVIVNINA